MGTESTEGVTADDEIELRETIAVHGAVFASLWEQDLQKLVGRRLPSLASLADEAEKELGSRPSHGQALRAIINNYVGGDDWDVQYHSIIPGVLEFVASALASGVIGNLSYDTLKKGWAAHTGRRRARNVDSRNLDLVASVAVLQYLHSIAIEVSLSDIEVFERRGTPSELHIALRVSEPKLIARVVIPLRAPEGSVDHELIVHLESENPSAVAQMALKEYAKLIGSSIDPLTKPRELKAIQKAVETLQLRQRDRSDASAKSPNQPHYQRDTYLAWMNKELLSLAWREGLQDSIREVLAVEAVQADDDYCLTGLSPRDIANEFVKPRRRKDAKSSARQYQARRVIEIALAVHDGTLALIKGSYYNRLPNGELEYSPLNPWRPSRRGLSSDPRRE